MHFTPTWAKKHPAKFLVEHIKFVVTSKILGKTLYLKSLCWFAKNFMHFTPTWAKKHPTKFLVKHIKFLVASKILGKTLDLKSFTSGASWSSRDTKFHNKMPAYAKAICTTSRVKSGASCCTSVSTRARNSHSIRRLCQATSQAR